MTDHHWFSFRTGSVRTYQYAVLSDIQIHSEFYNFVFNNVQEFLQNIEHRYFLGNIN